MSFPSSILSITNPIGTNFLNSPDHAQEHTLVNNDLIAVETYIGVQNSPVSSTLTYQIQNPLSNGGGHIQTPNTGGTGLTTYTKGDILVGQSSSVIGKQAVGTDGLALVADSTQTNGLAYKQVLTAPAIQQQQAVYAQGSVISASVFAAQIAPTPSLVQGTSFDIKWPQTNTTSVLALTISSIVAVRVKNPDGTNPAVGAIKASVIGTVKFDAVSSVFQLSDTSDASQLVGTLPALNGSNLTNVAVTAVNISSNLTSSSSTTQNIDTVVTTGFPPRTITLYYNISGITAGVARFSSGIAIYDNTGTLKLNQAYYTDVANTPTAITTATLTYGTTAPSAGDASGSFNTVTLTIPTVTATGFTLRAAYSQSGGPTGQVLNCYAITNQ